MTTNIPPVNIKIGANSTQFDRAMRGVFSSLGRVGPRAAVAAKGLAVLTGAIGATAAAAGAMTVAAAESATQIQRFARLANTTNQEFQRMAAGAATAGVAQEQLADMLKDVNDRVGDFLATGAGPMADFFENIAPKVGVTADQFARLSGPQALQLYVDSLQAAGVNQQEMTFYLEAMASDLTLLQPLLMNGGTEMRRLGDEAARSGAIMSDAAIKGGAELNREMGELARQLRTSVNSALLDNADDFADLADTMSETVIPVLGRVAGAFATIVSKAISAGAQAVEFAKTVAEALTPQVPAGSRVRAGLDPRPRPGEPAFQRIPGMSTPNYQDLGVLEFPVDPPRTPPRTPPGGGGGRSGPTREDFDRLRDGYATQRELIETERQTDLDLLQQYLDAGVAAEQEAKDLSLRIEKKHAEDRRAIMMQGLQGALGDASALMQAENEKLFKIGKAASIANAVINGQEAASAAWARGMAIGGPLAATAYAGASLARTGAMIGAIQSTTIGGGGGASGGGGGAVASGGATSGGTTDNLNINLSVRGSGDLTDPAAIDAFSGALLDNLRDRGVAV
jgi:hypothetical protein